jgi:hypothetical protein
MILCGDDATMDILWDASTSLLTLILACCIRCFKFLFTDDDEAGAERGDTAKDTAAVLP